MTAPVDPDEHDEMLLRYKNGEISEAAAREFFGGHFVEAAGAVVAMQHIDAADKALPELNTMNFDG